MYAEVLVEYTNKAIDKTFTYIVKEEQKDIIKVGMKVKVPFGKKILNGIVTNITETKPEYNAKNIISIDNPDNYLNKEQLLKEIKELITPEFVLNKELLSLGKYLQEKTLCSKIVAYQTMLPSSLKVKEQKTSYQKYDTYIVLNQSKEETEKYLKNTPTKPTLNKFLALLLSENKLLKKEIPPYTLKKLQELNLVKEEKIEKYRLELHEKIKNRDFNLTKKQFQKLT